MSRLVLLPLLFSLSLLGGCTKKEVLQKSPGVPMHADIRSVDFRNFDFPKIPGEVGMEIRLRNGRHRNLFRSLNQGEEKDSSWNGEADLAQVIYNYDNEAQPIALVVVNINSGGTGWWSEVFLYRWVETSPRLMWSFESGDRADGGLRALYFENGRHNLVMELYQETEDDPLCCASHFARHFYNWEAGKFKEIGKEEWIPLPKQPQQVMAQSRH